MNAMVGPSTSLLHIINAYISVNASRAFSDKYFFYYYNNYNKIIFCSRPTDLGRNMKKELWKKERLFLDLSTSS